jgi:hypothetical protein
MDYKEAFRINQQWKEQLNGHPAFYGQGMTWHVARYYPFGDLRFLSRHQDGSYWWKRLPIYKNREVAVILAEKFSGY